MTRLLQKNKWKLKETDVAKGKGAAEAFADDDKPVQSESYDKWNEALAKKFAVMYKKYHKFRMSVMKNENDEEITKVLEGSQLSEEDEDPENPEIKKQS